MENPTENVFTAFECLQATETQKSTFLALLVLKSTGHTIDASFS